MTNQRSFFRLGLRLAATAVFAVSCASTELSVPRSHPGNPDAPSGQVAFAEPLVGTPNTAQPRPVDSTPPAHEHAATYTCPMHPDVVRDQPGACPICGMKLVPKKADK